ncbi:MAG: ATP-binding protein [Bacteroidales bacterium]|nr:ATP-binding protein [Bacteroidales bacterium]
MNELIDISKKRILGISQDFTRYLYTRIDWNKRLIGIKGARGTGKTTLILQWLSKSGISLNQTAYFSVDDLYFANHTLVETARDFYNLGGKIIAFDEVHKYPEWSKEIKIIYDRYQDLKIIFSGSSIIDIAKQEGDLSRRAVMYELVGLSFREYLSLKKVYYFNPISLSDLLDENFNNTLFFNSDFRPYQYFTDYLKYGFYPFSIEDEDGYPLKLRQLVRHIIEVDMAELKGFDIRNAKKMLQLITIISQQVPFKPNINALAQKTQLHRNSLSNYLYFLEEARLIRLLFPSGNSVANLQKPEKIYLNNPNLMYALAQNQIEAGNIRETFVYSQLSVNHLVTMPKNGDFEIDQKITFEVGGKNKTRKQIKEISESYVVKDQIEFKTGNEIPLWLLGFLY